MSFDSVCLYSRVSKIAVTSKCRENDFNQACRRRGTAIFLPKLTLSDMLSSNSKISLSVDPQFSHKLLFHLYLFQNKFFHFLTTQMDEST